MARASSFLLVTSIAALGFAGVVSSCTSSPGTDGDAGAGGDVGTDAGASSGGSAGTTAGTGGTSAGEGGASAGEGGAGGAGGVSSRTCMNPASGNESAKGQSCLDYCAALFENCPGTMAYADEAECIGFCENYADAQLCCRAFHVLEAGEGGAGGGGGAGGVSSHCAAAEGEELCN